MTRTSLRCSFFVFTLLCFGLVLSPAPALGDGEPANKGQNADPKKAEALPTCDTDEDVAAALEEFKTAFKAKGLKGDERSAQRDFALEQLSAYQHAKIVDVIAKAMTHSDENVRLAAVTHMATQRALPVQAGEAVLKAAKRYRKDIFFQMSALDTIGKLRYLGGTAYITEALEHQDFGVIRSAITAIGNLRDHRLMYPMLKVVGIDAERVADGTSTSGAEQASQGYSWDGAEASVDTGTSGDGDQKEAERQAKEQAAENKAAAESKAGGGGMGSVGGGGGGMNGASSGRRGGGGRNKQELIHPIKATLAKLTGEDFDDAKSIFKWLRANGDNVKELIKVVNAAEKTQEKAAKEAAKKK